MALEEYQQKRQFDGTPEPRGERGAPSGGQLRFVVQKHAASRLHYDFRLEMDGVLKSWAVPKGPSLDPADKRLAMMTEDHPMDYREFEGTIPKGHYGAGTVMVWDEGYYSDADDSDDVEAAVKNLRAGLAKGDLKFTLHGQKLNGSWVLAKMHSDDAEENAWLMIKHKDDFANADDDVTAQDRSAVSGRSMEEIAHGGDKPWVRAPALDFGDAPKAEQPRTLEPMLATLAEVPFDNPEWLYEVKWDGYRIMAHLEGGDVRLMTRGDQDYTARYQAVARELRELQLDAILDGEMVVVDENGRSDFEALQDFQKTGRGQLLYYVFDMPYAGGRDLRGLALTQRKELAGQVIFGLQQVRISDHVTGDGTGLFALAEKQHLEGIMAKRADSQYRDGKRGRDWLKIKTHLRQEAVVGGFTEPQGSRRDLGALVLGVYDDDGKLQYVGQCGGGFSEKGLSEAYERLHPLERKTSPFSAKFKTNAPAHWVAPTQVAEVSFAGWTSDGLMRQPIFVGWREDKAATEVRRELPVADVTTAETRDLSPEPQPAKFAPNPPSRGTESTGRGQVSHRDKVFWPEEHITKGELADYYWQVADVLLPHLRERPESLNRFPNGISDKSFFQKDVESAPDWVKTVKIYSESNNKDVNWVLCDDRDTLMYLVNLGCIELNPWHSRAPSLEQPDYCLLDLDAKTLGFEEVITVAVAAHKLLDEYGIEGYPKTSGKTGLHICIPLGAKYSFDQSRQFAEILMNLLHERLPELTSVDRNPAKREGKIYLDYLQNRHGQTMASAYCVRPVPGATVSTPLRWDEVKPGLDPKTFTIKNTPARIDKLGDLWQPVLGPGVNLEAVLARMSS